RDRETGFLKGRTRNYIPVFMEGGDGLKGREVRVRLSEIRAQGMVALRENPL
ncbi:MAG: hypothetical protein HY883_04280, partial [Deltaproteobacteria bacterium]|nr:hypothetical protein [Deltaproteobacteria bacterium]